MTGAISCCVDTESTDEAERILTVTVTSSPPHPPGPPRPSSQVKHVGSVCYTCVHTILVQFCTLMQGAGLMYMCLWQEWGMTNSCCIMPVTSTSAASRHMCHMACTCPRICSKALLTSFSPALCQQLDQQLLSIFTVQASHDDYI